MRSTALGVMVAVLAGILCSAARGQGVVNPGFETGDFSGWTVQRAPLGSNVSVVTSLAHSGTHSARFGGSAGLDDRISQLVVTSAGQSYGVSFWVYNEGSGSDRLAVFWEGNSVIQQAPITQPPNQWSQISFDVFATANGSLLTIGGFDGPAYLYIDDIEVAPRPINDNCSSAIDLSSGGTFYGTLENSTRDGDAPCQAFFGPPDVWYKVTTPPAPLPGNSSGGRLSVDTCGTFGLSMMDTLLSLHSACGDGGTVLACNDDWVNSGSPPASGCSVAAGFTLDAQLQAAVESSTTSFIRVTRLFGSSDSTFVLHVNFEPFGAKNGSFETGPGGLGTLPNGSTAISNWTVTRGSVDWTNVWQSADGSRSIDLQGLNSNGGVMQTVNTIPGHRYRVTFALAGNPDSGPTIKKMNARAENIEEEFTFDITGKSYINMGFVDHSIAFVATSDHSFIEFYSSLAAPGSWGPVIDNVRLAEEPAPPCNTDFNHDGVLNPDDLSDYIGAYFNIPPDPAADFNADGLINPDDLSDYITAYFEIGC